MFQVLTVFWQNKLACGHQESDARKEYIHTYCPFDPWPVLYRYTFISSQLTHTHTRARARARARTHTRRHAHTHARTHAHTHTHSKRYTHARIMHTHKKEYIHRYTYSHTYTAYDTLWNILSMKIWSTILTGAVLGIGGVLLVRIVFWKIHPVMRERANDEAENMTLSTSSRSRVVLQNGTSKD